MLETIIVKLCFLLGNRYGYDYDDLYYDAELTNDEVNRIKEIMEDKDEL